MHFQEQTSITRIWAEKGSEPKVMSKPGRKKVSYSGFIIPESGELVVTKPSWFNYETVIQSLREFLEAKPCPEGKKYCVVLDNAPWHKKAIRLKGSFFTKRKLDAMNKKGNFTQNGVHLQEHEWKTVKTFLDMGKDITLQPPIQAKNTNSADMWMDGILWEIKAPEGGSRNTIRHNLERAKKQSRNIIFDLHRCKLDDKQAIKELRYHFGLSKIFQRMKIVTKSRKILDFPE